MALSLFTHILGNNINCDIIRVDGAENYSHRYGSSIRRSRLRLLLRGICAAIRGVGQRLLGLNLLLRLHRRDGTHLEADHLEARSAPEWCSIQAKRQRCMSNSQDRQRRL